MCDLPLLLKMASPSFLTTWKQNLILIFRGIFYKLFEVISDMEETGKGTQ